MEGIIHEIGFDVERYGVLPVPPDQNTGWFFGDPGSLFSGNDVF